MKTYIQITNGKFYLVDDGNTVEITGRDPKNADVLKLPENSSNRKWLNKKKVVEAGGTFELTYKESKHFDKTAPKAPKTDWYEYLTEEEKDMYSTLKENALRRMNDPLEIARRAYEKAQAEYEALLAEQQAKLEEADNLEDELE